jgi:hypothetical protein
MGVAISWIVGLISGLVGGLSVGGRAWLQYHFLRRLLRHQDLIPKDYVRFLDYAAERVYLRKVGGGYIFVHRLLQEYFCDLWPRDVAAPPSG